MVALLTGTLVASVAPREARAGFSAVDGRLLGSDVRSVHTWVGAPDFGVEYLGGQMDFDFGFALRVDYLKPSFDPGFLMRFGLLEGDDFSLGLRLRAGPHWNTGWLQPRRAPANLGLRVAPELALAFHPHPVYSQYFALEVPFLWTWRYGGGVVVPMRVGLGFEYAMSPDINFVAFGGVGGRYEAGGGHVGGWSLDGLVRMGISFQLF